MSDALRVVTVTTPEGTVVRCNAALARRIGWLVEKRPAAKKSTPSKPTK